MLILPSPTANVICRSNSKDVLSQCFPLCQLPWTENNIKPSKYKKWKICTYRNSRIPDFFSQVWRKRKWADYLCDVDCPCPQQRTSDGSFGAPEQPVQPDPAAWCTSSQTTERARRWRLRDVFGWNNLPCIIWPSPWPYLNALSVQKHVWGHTNVKRHN